MRRAVRSDYLTDVRCKDAPGVSEVDRHLLGRKKAKLMKGSPLHCRAYKVVANISVFISDQTCPPGVLFPFNMGRHLIVVVVGWWADGGVGLG